MTTPRSTIGVATWRPAAVSGAGALVVGAALVLRDPHTHGSWGECPFYAATGLYCPGCGSLRAINDLLTGHIGAAFGSNVLTPLALGWLAWWWPARLPVAQRLGVRPEPSGRAFGLVLLAVIVMFTVGRNLPGSPLAP